MKRDYLNNRYFGSSVEMHNDPTLSSRLSQQLIIHRIKLDGQCDIHTYAVSVKELQACKEMKPKHSCNAIACVKEKHLG